MFRAFFLAFLIVSTLEVLTLIQVGGWIGFWPTFFLIVGISLLGASLLKKQGMRTLMQIRQELAMGMIPGETLLDGACILVGGTLLLAPGFLTDALGLLLMLPFMRLPLKRLLKLWLMKLMQKGKFITYRRF
ncbi:MAG TPA: FxsA family protein [Bacilli bacterium]|nr:FxsA family protein [Bacilli bacterium]